MVNTQPTKGSSMADQRPKRRISVGRRTPKAPTQEQMEKVEELLKKYGKLQGKVAAVKDEMAEVEAEIDTIMRAAKIEESHTALPSGEYLKAEVKEVFGNAKNIIDPKAFFDKLRDKTAAFSAMTVISAKAKELLSGKELAEITDSQPGESKGIQLVIKNVKKL